MVNKTLFAGNYKAEDSSGKISIFGFTNDGKISGLPQYKKYYIQTDFVAESENRFDQVYFDIQTNNQRSYGFKINNDTIKLFDISESGETSKLGSLKYQLVRQ